MNQSHHPYSRSVLGLNLAAAAIWASLASSHSIGLILQHDGNMAKPHDPKRVPSRWDVAVGVAEDTISTRRSVSFHMGATPGDDTYVDTPHLDGYERSECLQRQSCDLPQTSAMSENLLNWAARHGLDPQYNTFDRSESEGIDAVAVVLLGARPNDEADLVKTIRDLAAFVDPASKQPDEEPRDVKVVFIQLGTDPDCAKFLNMDLPAALADQRHNIVSSFTHHTVQTAPNLAELVRFAVTGG